MSTEYLQRGFIDAVWPQAVDLLSNEIIHNAYLDADKRGFDLRVSETSLDMSAPPGFTPSAPRARTRPSSKITPPGEMVTALRGAGT